MVAPAIRYYDDCQQLQLSQSELCLVIDLRIGTDAPQEIKATRQLQRYPLILRNRQRRPPPPPGTLSANMLLPAILDTIQAVTLTISVFALVASLWAANETRQTRLDARRTLLRNEAYATLIELRSSLNTFNCYALVKGVEIKEKDSFMKYMDEQGSSIRAGMIEMWDYPTDGLTAYEKSLNTNKTQARSTFHQTITMIRNSWDKDLREKADSICKF